MSARRGVDESPTSASSGREARFRDVNVSIGGDEEEQEPPLLVPGLDLVSYANLAEGTPDEIRANQMVHDIYLGRHHG